MGLSAFQFIIFIQQHKKLKDLSILNILNHGYRTAPFKKHTLKHMQIYYLIYDRPRSAIFLVEGKTLILCTILKWKHFSHIFHISIFVLLATDRFKALITLPFLSCTQCDIIHIFVLEPCLLLMKDLIPYLQIKIILREPTFRITFFFYY